MVTTINLKEIYKKVSQWDVQERNDIQNNGALYGFLHNL